MSLLETFDTLYRRLVNPHEPFLDDADGESWLPLLSGRDDSRAASVATEEELAAVREECRALAVSNEFAVNGHENRISYVVGTGHAYHLAAKPGAAVPPDELAAMEAVLSEFREQNGWYRRQQEVIRRKDRDGECFLRLFPAPDGSTAVRFVEPGEVTTPKEKTADISATFGIQTDPRDVESVRGYYVNGRFVSAAAIQHRKTNVDANVKRGLPLFFPVRKNLRRAENLLRNMSVLAEIQSAIALIRKHDTGAADGIRRFVENGADDAGMDPCGSVTHYRRYAPGTILDASAGIDYEFPAIGLDVGRYVAVLKAELRAIASRLVMPEFMLTSDASNANYASTMVAEGPAVKMFERLQHEMIEEDRVLFRRVLAHAAACGRFSLAAVHAVQILATAPLLTTRDRLKEARADEILVRNGAMTPEVMAKRHGL